MKILYSKPSIITTILLIMLLTWHLPAKAGAPKDMVLVPAGYFQIGSNQGRADEKPARRVWMDAFYIDRHEVTNKQFARFLNKKMKKPPSEHWQNLAKVSQFGIKIKGWNFKAKPDMASMPVVFIAWREAYDYCRWAGKELPSQAQWERACSLGNVGQPPPPSMFSLARSQNIHRWWRPYPDPVGSHAPDALGLYDMLGNVAEFTEDIYLANWYSRMPLKNPIYLKAPPITYKRQNKDNPYVDMRLVRRVAKGGSFSTNPGCARCSFRSFRNQSQADMNNFTGFRCSLRIKPADKQP